MTGILYVVSTPIGNLKDITYRAVECLREVNFIACEDTRRSKILLNHYGISNELTSLFQGNESKKSDFITNRLLTGENGALISEAGTPNISDPGYRLVALCIEKGIEVRSVPGPSAVVSAVSISGLPTDSFIFEGFLPVKKGARIKRIERWRNEPRTVVFYESPHRILRCLENLREVFGNIRVVLAREMTKMHEEVIRKPVDEVIEDYKRATPRGEFVVLINLRTSK